MLELTFTRCFQEHLELIPTQPHDYNIKRLYLSSDFRAVLASNFSMSAWAGAKCVGAAGIIPLHDHCALAWALLGANAGPYMRQITRKVKSAIDISPYSRVEIAVDSDFEEGHRWAKILGFTLEAPRMRKRGVLGNDESVYARIK